MAQEDTSASRRPDPDSDPDPGDPEASDAPPPFLPRLLLVAAPFLLLAAIFLVDRLVRG
jgi:hypothetical protein